MEGDDPYARINAQAFLTTFDTLLARPDCNAERSQSLLQAKAAFQRSGCVDKAAAMQNLLQSYPNDTVTTMTAIVQARPQINQQAQHQAQPVRPGLSLPTDGSASSATGLANPALQALQMQQQQQLLQQQQQSLASGVLQGGAGGAPTVASATLQQMMLAIGLQQPTPQQLALLTALPQNELVRMLQVMKQQQLQQQQQQLRAAGSAGQIGANLAALAAAAGSQNNLAGLRLGGAAAAAAAGAAAQPAAAGGGGGASAAIKPEPGKPAVAATGGRVAGAAGAVGGAAASKAAGAGAGHDDGGDVKGGTKAKPGGEDDVTAGGGIAETDALAGTGLNLVQETEALMTTQAGKTVRHLKDVIPAFKEDQVVNTGPLKQLMARTAVRHGVTSCDPSAVAYLAQAVEAHMAQLLTSMARLAQQRKSAAAGAPALQLPASKKQKHNASENQSGMDLDTDNKPGTDVDALSPQPGQPQSLLVFRKMRPLLVKHGTSTGVVSAGGSKTVDLVRVLAPGCTLSAPSAGKASTTAAGEGKAGSSIKDYDQDVTRLEVQDLIGTLERDTLLSRHPILWKLHHKLP